MAVYDHITALWQATERMLLDDVAVDYDRARDNAILAAATALYREVAPGAAVPNAAALDAADILVQQHIADLAVRQLIPLAKDVIARQEALSHSEALQPGGSGGTTYYNRLQALNELDTTLVARLTERAASVRTAILLVYPLPPVSAPTRPLIFRLARGYRGRLV